MLGRFTGDTFRETYDPTVGVGFGVKIVEVEGKKIKLTIWDVSGSPQYQNLRRPYYKPVVGIGVVYDVSDVQSFAQVGFWFNDVLGVNGTAGRVLIGNKCDSRERKITTQEGESLARQFGALFIETSALNSTNIQEAFYLFYVSIKNESKK
uniref:Uncharacterized protein n=1 Tax=Arcella intermedia TaxID=1963864 RepID=A0A6B2LM83_9EUKA